MTDENKGDLDHNKITQAMYDEKASRARLLEGQIVTYEKKAKDYEKFGAPEDIAAKLKLLETLENGTVKTPEDTDKLVAKRLEEFKKQIAPDLEKKDGTIKELSNRLHKIEVVDKAMDTASKEFLPSAVPLIKEVYISKYVRRDDDGNLIAVDDKGETRFLNGKPMQLADLLAEIKENHPDLVAGKPSNNSRPAGEIKANKGSSLTPEAIMRLPLDQQSAAWREHGLINKI